MENGDSAKVRIGMRKAAKVERMEERIRGRRAAARKEKKGKKRVAQEIPEHDVGRAVRQDTLQIGAEKEETKNCTPLKTTVRTLISRPKTKRICKHGACWRKARTKSGKR